MKKHLIEIGTYLKSARLSAGYSSLDTGTEAINSQLSDRKFSRSTLHLVEKGKISDLDPSLLKALCTSYNISYEDLVRRYIAEKYEIETQTFLSGGSQVLEENQNTLSLKGSGDKSIQILNLEHFEKIQSDLPPESIVGVSAHSFLDDSIFFDMVSKNILSGIKYYYHLPSACELRYRNFLSRLTQVLLKESLETTPDNNLTYFVPRGISEFPLNAILFIYPDRKLQGFIGLTSGDKAEYYQSLDSLVTWRLYQSFLMSIALSEKAESLKLREKISSSLHKGNTVRNFPVLLDHLE